MFCHLIFQEMSKMCEAETEALIFWPLGAKSQLSGKDSHARKD